jgi:antibiotic biosynthesis monooxygenase (ABM) superfamily enzyme
MAEADRGENGQAGDRQAANRPVSPAGGPATPPRVLPALVLYSLGRVVIAVALISIIWIAGLPGFPALLFGLLLSMPVSFLLLRPVRERLIEAWIARRDAKENLRARLSGTRTDPTD